MYYKLNSSELGHVIRASKITCTDYELLGNFIPVESMMAIIEDLLIEIDRMEEAREEFEQEVEDNYRPYTRAELYDIRESDFY